MRSCPQTPAFQGRGIAAYTLLELLVTIGIIALLTTFGVSGWKAYRGLSTGSVCSSNLRQLSAAVAMYSSDNYGAFPPYLQIGPNGERTWYFGFESSPAGTPEGERDLDITAGPLYPYIEAVGQIEVCPGFNYGNAIWKPKFKGASYGYGYNWLLGGRTGGMPMNVAQLSSSSRVMLFGDCAQANTFQSPASPDNPMLEEFYIINETERTVHFRHGRRANILFVDGHVESMKVHPGTEDTSIKSELLGRITPKGSLKYLK